MTFAAAIADAVTAGAVSYTHLDVYKRQSLSGAAGVICINVGGFGQEGDNVLVSEDICGPADLMVFSIGKRDGADLKEIMKRSESAEMKVVLSARSKVSGGGVSYNVWGDIPGKDVYKRQHRGVNVLIFPEACSA